MLTDLFWRHNDDPGLMFNNGSPLMTEYQIRMILVCIYRSIKPHSEENERSALYWETDRNQKQVGFRIGSIRTWIKDGATVNSIQGKVADQMKYPTPLEFCQIIRCIAGYPWEQPRPWEPTDAVIQLAEVIALHQSYQDLPLLADAAEEAGMHDESILRHLRSDCPHFKGCHALQHLRRS